MCVIGTYALLGLTMYMSIGSNEQHKHTGQKVEKWVSEKSAAT